MLSAYEQHLLACYLANAASAIHHLDVEAWGLAWWAAQREDRLRCTGGERAPVRPPGTGKTQFCKVLAERLGVTLFSVGESDEDGDEPARGDRLQELRLAQRLLGRDGRSLLLFDEMEDLLADAFPTVGLFGSSFNARVPEGGSKVFMHRLLEQAPTPTLWTMNNARTVSDAILHHMMFALELRRPTVRVRARMWARQLQRHGIEAGPDEAHSLAAEFEATPGVAAGATAAARLGGGDIATAGLGTSGRLW